MAKSELELLLEQKTIEALQYIDNMAYEPDTNGYEEVMKEVRENYKLLMRAEVLKEEKRKERITNTILGLLQILIPAGVYLVVGKTCLVYEENGAITSAIGRSLINKIRPD